MITAYIYIQTPKIFALKSFPRMLVVAASTAGENSSAIYACIQQARSFAQLFSDTGVCSGFPFFMLLLPVHPASDYREEQTVIHT